MWCKYCKIDQPTTHWGSKKRCKRFYADYEKQRRHARKTSMTIVEWRLHQKQEYQKRAPYHRYRALKQGDKDRGLEFDLSFKQYQILCAALCNWCNISQCNGVDRLDSDRGHALNNVVPCCEQCNILLTDLPWECKSLLASGLKHMRDSGVYDRWTVPYKR